MEPADLKEHLSALGSAPPPPLRTKRWLGIAMFVFVAIGCPFVIRIVSAAFSKSSSHVVSSSPPVIVTPESLDFRSTWESTAFHHILVLENSTNQVAVIRDISIDCRSTVVDFPKPLELQPGVRVAVSIRIDLSKLIPPYRAQDMPVQLPVLVSSGFSMGSISEARFILRGTVRRVMTCQLNGQPSISVPLGESLSAGVPGEPLEFRLMPKVPIKHLSLASVPDGWSASISRDRSSRGKPFVLRAQACKQKLGKFIDAFEIELVLENGSQLTVRYPRLTGTVCDGIEVFPKPGTLGNVPVRNIVQTLWIKSRLGKPIQHVELIQAEKMKMLAMQQIDADCRLTVEHAVEMPGAGRSTALIRASDGGRRVDIPIQCNWYAVNSE